MSLRVVLDEENPLLPTAMMMRGRGKTIYFDPNPDEIAELGYRRFEIERSAKLIVDAVRKTQSC